MNTDSINISIDSAREMIKDHEGVLNRKLSILPPLEVYELNNNTLLAIKVYAKLATLYYDKASAIKDFESSRPKGFFESYQNELINFPANKKNILMHLSKELNVQIEPNRMDKLYLDEISKKVKKYTVKKAQNQLFLGLVTLMGESIIDHGGGEWEVETVDFPYPQLQPYILNTNGRKETNFIKLIADALFGDKGFDWYAISIFVNSRERKE